MNLTENELHLLKQRAVRVREHIIRMATDGGCFLGASLSCADLLVYLYSHFLNIRPETTSDMNRDYLFLSKGHDVPALYGTFAELGFIEKERLKNHLKPNDHIYWHPNRHIPGVEFHSGSLGHLLSVAMGVAYDCRLRNQNNKIIAVLGDGELNEGSVWEGCLVARAYHLTNLIVVVDRNQFQANMATEKLIPLESIERKFESFGWITHTVDGHNFNDLHEIFTGLDLNQNWPNVVIAETTRGRGLPSIEARADRWFCNFSAEEIEALLEELHTKTKGKLTSETLTVR